MDKQRLLAIALSVTMVFMLTACGTKSTEQSEPQEQTGGAVAEDVEQEPGEAVAAEDLHSGDNSASAELLTQHETLTSDELLPLFEEAYSLYKEDETGAGYDMELMSIEDGAMALGKQLPSDYEEQYKVWREGQAQGSQQTPSTSAPFTEVNETVYATGTVNIRAGYSADSDKLGSLSTGSSVTRTGIGTEDADGWSRVSLSDGTVAYISSQYLSTTKPSTPSGGSGSSKPSSGSQGGSTYSPSGAKIVDGGIDGVTPPGGSSGAEKGGYTDIEDPYDTIYKPIF